MESNNQTQQEIVKDPRICIALPVYGKADVPFVVSLIQARDALQCVGHIDWLPGDSLVNRARNNLAGRFLSGFDAQHDGKPVKLMFDWLLFIDTDLVFPPQAVQRIYELGTSKGPGVYCGIYPIKQLKPKIVFNNLPGEFPDPATGLVRVREAGTGFMMIHREVFEKMRERYRDEIEFIADTGTHDMQKGWDFFSVGVRLDKTLNRKRFLSEDWYFCQRWREMGGEVWLDTRIQCGHIGTFTYPGSPKDVCEAADHYRAAEEKMKQAQAAQPIKVKTVKSDVAA